jgi:PPOX class probable F420-dependent enzyme
VIDHYTDDWATLWWVRLDGTAEVIASGAERDEALECLRSKYHQYVREPPPGPVIAVKVTGWRAWP